MWMLLALAGALIPALLAPSFSFYFDVTPKVVALLLAVAVALLFWRRPPGLFGWLLAAQLVWLGVATAASTHLALSLNGGAWRRFGFVTSAAILLYALMVLSDARDRVTWYLRAIVATGLPIALYGIMQHYGLDPLLSSISYHSGDAPFTIVRPPSTLGHASYFATYLVFVVFAALGCGKTSRVWTAVGWVTALVSLFAIVLSGTRAALVGVAAGGLLLLVRMPRLPLKRIAALAGACALALAVLYLSPAGEGLRTRLHWALEEPLGGARPLLWRDSLRMAAERPWLGYGPETFGAEFPRHESVELARAWPDFQHESPHNVFLDILLAQGIPGLLLFLATLAMAFLARGADPLVRTGPPGPARPSSVPILTAGLAGALVAQQFNALTLATALPLYLFVALLAGASEAPQPVTRLISWPRLAYAVAAVGFVVFATHLALADHELARARDSFTRLDLPSALAHYESARRWHPAGSSPDLYASRELANLFQRTNDVRVKLQTWTPAFQAAARATRADEQRHQAFYNLAIFFATQNDGPNVERSLRNALVWAPNWFKPHWALARLFSVEGRLSEARQEARLADDLDGGKDAQVRATLASFNGVVQ